MIKPLFALLFLVLLACTCLARPMPEKAEPDIRVKRDDGDDNGDDGDDSDDGSDDGGNSCA